MTKAQASLVQCLTEQFLTLCSDVKTVLLSGSVLRGDTILLSDLDLYLRLSPQLDKDAELRFYADLAQRIVWPPLDDLYLAGICNVQVRFLPEDHKFNPGLAKVVGGENQLPSFYSESELREEAIQFCKNFTWQRYYLEYFLHAGADWAIRLPRLVMIDVFPALRKQMIVYGFDPVLAWKIPKAEVIKGFGIDPVVKYWNLLVAIDPRYPDPNAGLRCALAGVEVLKWLTDKNAVE